MTAAAEFLRARNFLLANRTDYEKAYRGFRWPELSDFNWALDYFDPMASDNDETALWIVNEGGGEVKLSFARISERSNQVANYLRSLGVQRGSRLLIMLGNELPIWELMLAAIKIGAVVIPATTLLTQADLCDRLERGRVGYVVASAAGTDTFEALPCDHVRIAVGGPVGGWHPYEGSFGCTPIFVPDGPTRATDPLLLYFTSGTTSKPKLVMHSHQSYPIGHLSTMYWIGLQRGDVHLNISSPGWAKHAWSCFFAPWNAGATVFVYNYGRFNPRTMLGAIANFGVTTLCAPPTIWRMLIQEDLAAQRTQLRELVSAGEPLNPEVIGQVQKAWGITIRDGYGQTETTAQVGNAPGQRIKAGSMGRALPGYRVETLDAEGKPASEGEICLALDPPPLGLMSGYADDTEMNVEVKRRGYYHTGDIAVRDEDGYITYVGRADDVFKASDYRISPFELESILIEHPAVGEAAVVPSPDPVRLAVPKAFLSLTQDYTPTRDLAGEIFAFARRRMAPYQRIRRLEFTDLPKTISGKIRRIELRNKEQGRPIGAARGMREYFEEDFSA